MRLRNKQLGNANMFQQLLQRLSSKGGAPKPNNSDPNDPNNKGKGATDLNKEGDTNKGDPNDPNKQTQKNPLDNFKDLFKIDSSAEAAAPSFSLDQEALTKLASSLDFTGQMNQELLDKLKSGDAETVQSTLNSLGRNVYATVLQHVPALTEKYVTARMEHSQKGLGKNVKQTLTQQALAKVAADNPVLKQNMEIISSFLLEKFPDADPDWLAAQTGEYFVQTAKLLSPDSFKSDNAQDTNLPQDDPRDVTKRAGFEWGKYLGESSPAASAKT